MNSLQYKNLIFDLGGVFLDVDYNMTRQSFSNLGIENFDSFYQQSFSNPLFVQLEKGMITPEIFYDHFRFSTSSTLTDEEIRRAWNAMLGKFREKSIALLPALKKRYNIYLLSNTNAIHYDAFMKIYKHQFKNSDFDRYFHKAYYSHLIYQRKPDAAAYQIILEENGLEVAETLFIDDTLKNIEGAEAIGIRTLFLQNNILLGDELYNHKII